MVASFVPYQADRFSSLSNLRDSRHAFLEHDGERAVSLALDLIEKHNLTQKYGISLLHRHFDIGRDEVLVDVNGTTTAWKAYQSDLAMEDSRFERYGGFVAPHSWMVVGSGHIMPYEFRFYNNNAEQPDVPSLSVEPSFVDEFSAILREQGLDQVLGLCSFDREPRVRLVEVTEGEANITFPLPAGKDFSDIDQSIPATWGHWGGPDGGKQILRGCFQMCVGPYDAHACNHVCAKCCGLLYPS